MLATILLIRSPWGQGIIVNQAISYVEKKTGTEFSIDRLFVTFSGNVFLEGVYLEDLAGDTLLYSENLEAGLEIAPLLNTGAIQVSKLHWTEAKAKVTRADSTEDFNFTFLLEAFLPQNEEPSATDSSSTGGLEISLDNVLIQEIDLSYQDALMGIFAELQLGKLGAEIPKIDLETLAIQIAEVSLSDTRGDYLQTKPFSESEPDSSASVLPRMVLETLILQNIQLNYDNRVDQQLAEVDIHSLQLKLPLADLESQVVNLDQFKLENSSILFHSFSPATESDAAAPESETATFSWPDWEVNAKEILLAQNKIEFKSSQTAFRRGYFNPEAIRLTELSARLSDFQLSESSASGSIESVSFREYSGFYLQEFALNVKLNQQSLQLDEFRLSINRSQLNGAVELDFASLADLIEQPLTGKVSARLEAPILDLRDAYFFLPELAEDSLLQTLQKQPFRADLDLDGSSSLLNLNELSVGWGSTSAFARGKISDPTDLDQLAFDLPEIRLQSQRETLVDFVSEADLGLRFPENVQLFGQASGNLSDLGADLELVSSMGDVTLLASYQDQDTLRFTADLQAKAIQLNRLLENPELDTVSFSLQASGSGSVWHTITADLEANFDTLALYENDYSGLSLSANLKNGTGDFSSALDSKNLRYQLEGSVDLDSLQSAVRLHLNLIGADLGAMKLTEKSTRTQFDLEASFTGNLEEFQTTATLSEGTIVQDENPFSLGTIWVDGLVKKDSTSFAIESNPLVGFVQANANPGQITDAMTSYLQNYLGMEDSSRNQGDVKVNMNFALRQDPLIGEVLLPGLTQLDSSSFWANFSEKDQTLTARVKFPFVQYGAAELDSLTIRLDGDPESFGFQFGLAQINAGPIAMDKTLITGDMADSDLALDIQFYQQDQLLTELGTELTFMQDSLLLRVNPDQLVLNQEAWSIPATNLLTYANQEIALRDMVFSGGGQRVQLTDQLDSLARPHLAAIFDGFRLGNITGFLNPEKELADGILEGQLIVQNPFGALGVLGNLQVDSLELTEVYLGNLALDAQAERIGKYTLEASLKDGPADLDLSGDFTSDEEAATFDLALDLNALELKILQQMIPDQLTESTGLLSGKIEASGTTADPSYKGSFTLNDASLTPTLVGTKYLFDDETVRLDNEGVYFNEFVVQDVAKNSFTLDGEIGTESFVNPEFDLSIRAENFMIINSSDEENELFYGNGRIDADLQLTGDLLLPVLRGNIKVKDQTDLTFLIPESQADLVERQGVVIFVNKANPDDILTRTESEISNAFSGYDLSLLLEVDPTARFKIIVDPRSGDNLALTASGELMLNIDPIGRMSLSGVLEVQDGHYELSLYNLVNRRFEISQGSSINWNGDPLDANLDLTAVYEVRTSPAALMASQLTGTGDATQNQYAKKTDFLVYLYLEGKLLEPLISFGLDMPEDERGEFGGNVYSQVQTISEQEGELNRQVFSLLVLNQFFPSGGSDGSNGGTEALARNSVSQLLSDQLNNFSNQLFGDSGFEVGFELDSYAEGQGGQAQTELNVSAQQTLFDDRLTVQVGSQFDIEGNSQAAQDAGAILGNISIEYTLTEDGRFKIRAFRKNQFESVIDGQLILTGMGVVFNREFNEFSQLWKSPLATDLEDQNNPIDDLKKEEADTTKREKQKPIKNLPKND